MFQGVIIFLGKKICRIYQYRNSQYRNDENVAVLTHLVMVLTYAVKKSTVLNAKILVFSQVYKVNL